MFGPGELYSIEVDKIPVKRFFTYEKRYVKRPPYQRKNVWPTSKKQKLLDSLFRRYYVPSIVLREVRISKEEVVREVVDGQQRIETVQQFFKNGLKTPDSLADFSEEYDVGGKYWDELHDEIKIWLEEAVNFTADIIKGIDDPYNREHHKIASEIFSRLQEGEDLNLMERMHARLSSTVRNVAVKYADDITFDFEEYKPVDVNPDKHAFFSYLKQDNQRMHHLLYFTRLLLLEFNSGKSDIGDKSIEGFFVEHGYPKGIGNLEFKETQKNNALKTLLCNLDVLRDILKTDVVVARGGKFNEFRNEYTIISFYLLVRHLREYYVFDNSYYPPFLEFIKEFYERWRKREVKEDSDLLIFADHRQHGKDDVLTRDRIIRRLFLAFLKGRNESIKEKDTNRIFDELQRLEIYRRDGGLCQECLRQGKPEEECEVDWADYEADHIIPHSKGGATEPWNGEVLHRECNRRKGGRLKV